MKERRKYTDEQLAIAVKNSGSVRQVIKKIGLVPAGGNYDTVNRKIKELGLNTSHFHGKGWNIGCKIRPNPPKPLREILVRNSFIQNSHLHKRLIKEGIKKRMCERCNRKKWVGQDIPLELHHINGNKTDNRLKNLMLLCANCHALTPYYRRPKKKVGVA